MFNYEYWGNNIFPMKVNMALEEYLLSRSAKENVATVRFFNVPKDSIVLGYAQATDVVKKADSSFDLVRRVTGGSHVQFGPNCIAYSFTVPRDGSFRTYEDMRRFFAAKVADALVNLGVDSLEVDNKASTINVDNKVVASHAILWGVESALLHGLMIVDPYNVDKIFSRVALQQRKIGGKFYTEYSALKNIPPLSALLDGKAQKIDQKFKTEFVKNFVADEILKEVTDGRHSKRQVDDKVLDETSKIISQKRSAGPWVGRRKPPFTEDEIEEVPGEDLDGPLKKNLGYCLFMQVKNKDFKKMAERV